MRIYGSLFIEISVTNRLIDSFITTNNFDHPLNTTIVAAKKQAIILIAVIK